jgi:hypothetical protein
MRTTSVRASIRRCRRRHQVGAATREDWQAVADELIAEAGEVNGEV